jgi:hypothetical protein
MKTTSKLLAIISILGLIIMTVSAIISLHGNNQTFDFIARIGAIIFTSPIVILQILFFNDKLKIAEGFWQNAMVGLAFFLMDFVFVIALNSVFGFLPNWRIETDCYLREYNREYFNNGLWLISMFTFTMSGMGSVFIHGLIIEPIKSFRKESKK